MSSCATAAVSGMLTMFFKTASRRPLLAVPRVQNLTCRCTLATNVKITKQMNSGSEHQRSMDDVKTNVFVDGEVKSKRTLKQRLEAWALSPDADPSAASTVAVRIRRQLQKMNKQQQTSGGNQAVCEQKKPRDLRHQTKDLSRLEAGVVAKILKDHVIYDEGDIIALDKPYGLPVHGGPGVRHSVESLLPRLANKLNRSSNTPPPTLHLIHRLDKETTGVMLLARSEVTARRLHAMFRYRQMIKRYWVITVGVPSPSEGIIDIPMIDKEIGGKHRMVVKPDLGEVIPRGRGMRTRGGGATVAVTKYKVLSEGNNCALVELEPNTGVKHQIRVHLAQGLGCPILGDHKYSHHNKLAPQRLSDGILRSLGISQQKARTVPMHLHARQLIIPDEINGRNLYISTRVPWHFSQNMKKLQLKYES